MKIFIYTNNLVIRRKVMKILPQFLLMLSMSFANPLQLQAQEISMDEYRAQLENWQQREADAKAQYTEIDNEIAAMQNELAGKDEAIKKAWDDVYTTIGVSESDVDTYRQDLQSIEIQVDGLRALSPENLYKRRGEIDELITRLNEKKLDESNSKTKIACLTEIQDLIASIEGKISQLKARLPAATYAEYTVTEGDYLWKISGKDDVYDNPYQWMRIYSYNRDMIKNPDMIFPNQTFKIHRDAGPNEYVVGKGDYLAKIAVSAGGGGNPAMWKKFFEANKDIIGEDASLIYPYTVLKIPQ